MLRHRLRLPTFRLERLSSWIADTAQERTVVYFRYRLVGQFHQNFPDNLPLVPPRLIETVDVLLDEGDDVALAKTLVTEIELVGLVVRLADDDAVGVSSVAVGQHHLDEATDPGLPVHLVAQVVGHVIDTHPLFESLEIR